MGLFDWIRSTAASVASAAAPLTTAATNAATTVVNAATNAATSSTSAAQPGIIPSQTLPTMKTGIQDGTSGLHYSGQTYLNQVNQMTGTMCGTTTATYAQVNEVFPNGVAPVTDTLTINPDTQRISVASLQSHVQSLQTSGVIPGQMADITQQIQKDQLFYAAMINEYCFYEKRYTAALTQFITEVSAPNATPNAGEVALQATIKLNKKLNILLEVMNYIGNQRATSVNNRSNQINEANNQINTRLQDLRIQQNFLQSSDVRLQTQTEMMRFSKEKNSAMNTQIMFFITLNVVALGTMLTVYKNLKPM
jgi:hypothetical protein